MGSTTAPSRRDAALIVAGIAMIVLPLVGLAIKLVWPGWLLFFILLISPVLLVGYAVQIVIAATGFLGRRGAFRSGTARTRGLIAAWLTSVGVVATAFFLVDSGDSAWGSAFMFVVGGVSDSVLGSFSALLSILAGIIWVGAWGWLLTEWIIALVARRRGRSSPSV